MKQVWVLWMFVFGVMLLGVVASTQLWPSAGIHTVPTLEARLLPGQNVPDGLSCTFYEPDFTDRYCQADGQVDVAIRGNLIQHAYIFTYNSGLQVGEVMLAWGSPAWADYYSYGAVEVYWRDRSAYVLDHEPFSPFSRVGFISFGPTQASQPWRGYQTATVNR
jgi:hypothetical protein